VSPVLVDSDVLLDVVTDDPSWAKWSSTTLARVLDESVLVINALVYAEVSTRLTTIEALDDALPVELYRRDNLPYEAAFLAGKVFLDYRRRGATRRSPLPDFYIGAHAAVAGFPLLTRDSTRYRTYFPGLSLISPEG